MKRCNKLKNFGQMIYTYHLYCCKNINSNNTRSTFNPGPLSGLRIKYSQTDRRQGVQTNTLQHSNDCTFCGKHIAENINIYGEIYLLKIVHNLLIDIRILA